MRPRRRRALTPRQQQAEEEHDGHDHVDRRAAAADECARRPHVERDGLAGEYALVVEPGDSLTKAAVAFGHG